jgi:hypothetical protein
MTRPCPQHTHNMAFLGPFSALNTHILDIWRSDLSFHLSIIVYFWAHSCVQIIMMGCFDLAFMESFLEKIALYWICFYICGWKVKT